MAESFKIASVPPNRYADFSLTELSKAQWNGIFHLQALTNVSW